MGGGDEQPALQVIVLVSTIFLQSFRRCHCALALRMNIGRALHLRLSQSRPCMSFLFFLLNGFISAINEAFLHMGSVTCFSLSSTLQLLLRDKSLQLDHLLSIDDQETDTGVRRVPEGVRKKITLLPF